MYLHHLGGADNRLSSLAALFFFFFNNDNNNKNIWSTLVPINNPYDNSLDSGAA